MEKVSGRRSSLKGSDKKKDSLNKDGFISVRGARVNNLKNIDADLPHNKLIVITGPSGSGKTSLAFDTIYAEGQRRYIESMSSYARQFLERFNKPEVDSISGLAPSIAIEARTTSRNPRSTVGTVTEIYDYLRLLYARAGKTYSPVSGNEVKRDTAEDVITYINNLPSGSKIYILFPVHLHQSRTTQQEIANLISKGYYRIWTGGKLIDLNGDYNVDEIRLEEAGVLADRLILDNGDAEQRQRLADSIELAFAEGDGYLSVCVNDNEIVSFNNHLEADGIKFDEPEPLLFSFNNPIGACPKCQGFGETIDIDYDLVIPDKNKSVFQNAIHPFSTPKHSKHLSDLLYEARQNNLLRIHVPYRELTDKEREIIFNGAGEYIGINKFFKYVEREAAYKIHYRVLLSRYRRYTRCSECGGSRLRKEALYVRFHGKNIHELVSQDIDSLYGFFRNIKLEGEESAIAGRLVEEITNRLKFLYEVGLGYLTLDRLSSTLSGGETQRINLATSLGSTLVGSIYVLDEPSIGLHPRDNQRLIKILKSLRDIGNTIIVIEHDTEIIRSGDWIVDMGPGSGEQGGEIIYSGSTSKIGDSRKSLTGKYLTGKLKINIPEKRRKIIPGKAITVRGASENNLKNINVEIPLDVMVCVTGVSGSGKSTLVNDILYGALRKRLTGIFNGKIGSYTELRGHQYIHNTELVDQTPIGRSPRSNPVTYMKIFDSIRELYGSLPASKLRGYSSGNFSFNIPGGRCETCEGSGVVKIAMQFMADIYLECDVCKGKRYKQDILEIEYKGKNISDVLSMTVSEATEFFREYPKIIRGLKILDMVGLGYLRLGQSATTLSGGEAQRIKLAYYLSFQTEGERTLFMFDEPTTGLHPHDISKLIRCFDELIKKGNSVLIVEHNLDVIKCADYVIDLGPESGNRGGYVVATGRPEEIANNRKSITGYYLKKVLS